MPETDTIPVSASVASTGTGIRYIGDYAYAYSGVISVVDGNETELLGFTTGSGVIVAEYVFYYAGDSPYNAMYKVKMNGEIVGQYIVGDADSYTNPAGSLPLIIPPRTLCSFTADQITSTSTFTQAVSLTGRVYGDK